MIVQTDPRAPRVVLVGPPGAGKTTIGRKLAKELGVELYDTDAGIERETGRTIPEIFATDGEPEFRRIEERVVRRAILAERGVVSLGGGAVLSKDTRALLRNRTVVYLEISVGEGLRRTGASTNRPLLNGADPAAKYRELMRKRRPLYREVATVRVRTDGRSPGRVVKMVLAKLGFEPVVSDTGADADCSDLTDTTTPATTAEATATPQGSSRSRARRRARARAAARRAAAAREAADGSGEQETSASAETSVGNAGRSWRTRRGGSESATSGADAPAAESAANSSVANGPSTADETAVAKSSGSTGRGWRARRSAAAEADATAPSNGTEDSGQGKSSSGRARRARARRARVRARKHQEASTESEQQT
ncbi:shikimate kinase [Nocardia sp. CS682]|nr:shikimate kinase [Nocardia sp. CS682]